MTFEFRPATRESAKLLIGLFGPSGGGKTMSALRIATGLANDGEIVFIDTERGRACQYAPASGEKASPPDSFAFVHGELEAPFSPARYRQALEMAIKRKPAVIIIDSMSHVWEGVGGMMEMVDAAKADGKRNDFSAWSKPKAEHARLIATLLQVPAHVIVCLRGKEKKALVDGPRGKKEVVDLGWRPVCESSLPYELTVLALLDGEKQKGVPRFDVDVCKLPHNMRSLFPDGEQITEALGERLAAWCSGDAKANPAPTPKPARDHSISIYAEDGAVAAAVPTGRDWLVEYRRLMQESGVGHRPAIAAINLQTLRKLAAKAPEDVRQEFEQELETAEALAEGP